MVNAQDQTKPTIEDVVRQHEPVVMDYMHSLFGDNMPVNTAHFGNFSNDSGGFGNFSNGGDSFSRSNFAPELTETI